jgi:sigma-E factor negative regulatory protein RseA
MSEQIREQISAFLDGELPSAESELLLKRMLRDTSLRDSFGRYSLIGEAMRGMKHVPLRGNFTGAINGAIDGEQARPALAAVSRSGLGWWRTLGGAAIAASVAVVAVVALQLRSPTLAPSTAGMGGPTAVPNVVPAVLAPKSVEPRMYVTPAAHSTPNTIPGAQLADYVFAHSQYASPLSQRAILTDVIVEGNQPTPEANVSTAR